MYFPSVLRDKKVSCMCSFELATMEFKNLFLNHTIQRVQPAYNVQCSVRFKFPLCWTRSEEAEGGQFPESASRGVCVDNPSATRPGAFSPLLGCRQLEGKVSSILPLLLASAWGLSLVAVVQRSVFNLCQRRSCFRHTCPALGHACTQARNISSKHFRTCQVLYPLHPLTYIYITERNGRALCQLGPRGSS